MRGRLVKLLILLMIIWSCSEQNSKNSIVIQGEVVNGEGMKLVLTEMQVSGLSPIDSTVLTREGHFNFSGRANETGFYLLMDGSGRKIPLVAAPGDQIDITTDSSAFASAWKVSGNHDSKILGVYFRELAKNEQALDSLSRIFINKQGDDDFYQQKIRLDRALDSLIENQKNYTFNYLQLHRSSFASLLIFNQRFAGQRLINQENNYPLMKSIDSLLIGKYPQNSHVNLFHERMLTIIEAHQRQIETEKRLSPGNEVPAISLRNEEDEKINLSELEGQKVLIFFWASYSPESRADLQQLKTLYRSPEARDFEVFAVSLDHNRKFWEAALEMENTHWVDVIDTRGQNSPLVRLYNLPGNLPFYYLIDEEGRIMMKSGDFSEVENALIN